MLAEYPSRFLAFNLILFSSLSYYPATALASKVVNLKDVGIDEHLGSSVDLTSRFKDELGNSVTLKKYVDGTKPIVLALVYYECPNLCTIVLSAATDSFKGLDWNVGEKFNFVAVSIDPRETPALAGVKRATYLKRYDRPHAANGWHFLTGTEVSIKTLANQVGFKYTWNKNQSQYAHASAIIVLTPHGRISRYFYGIDYPSRDLRVALLEASDGKIGTVVDKLLLFCFHYDSSAKKYVLIASRAIAAGGALMVLTLFLFFLLA